MDLKNYQHRVVREVERFLERVVVVRAEGNRRFASQQAWEDLRLGLYHGRKNGLGEDLPSFCIKVPTGGGKTLLATQALGSIYRTILKDRNGAGLVLWVVPSSQIYRDTLRRLRDRQDMYRLMLEHAVSRRIEIWEKHEVARLSPAKLRDCLNILMVQLASTNRETQEQLKFFRDSGGNIVQHFPPENDPEAHRKLKEEFPNLDMLEDDAATGQHLVATSIGNLVRICRPAVIVDEGHKATSRLARQTIEGFNASVVVELSATPKSVRATGEIYQPNVLTRVTGKELLDEQMIKLPLNIATSGQKSWTDALTQARDRRQALAEAALKHAAEAGPERLIRPIVLVQVQRTGRDQRDGRHIHSEQVKEHLTDRLGVPASAIAIKSADKDDLIEHTDLLDPGCPVEWIITKSALQEGWDCPFAYILVSLDNTGSGLNMTQIIGRILRQPFQQRTKYEELNESYVYCLHKRSDAIAREVKTALEQEGYEGEAESMVVDAAGGDRAEKTVTIRQEFLELYTRPFEGKIYLPHFCVKEGSAYAQLDYFQHLVRHVDVSAWEYSGIDWRLAEDMGQARDRYYRMTLGENIERVRDDAPEYFEDDESVLAWLVASLPFDYLSHKQLWLAVREIYEALCTREMVRNSLALVKFVVRDHIEKFIQEQVDKQTHAAFDKLFASGSLLFYLECAQCRFEIPREISIRSRRPLVHHDGSAVQKSLFDYVEHETTNEYERAVALCLDRHAEVLWWYRNLVGPEYFSVQGYRRYRIRPDFVVQTGTLQEPQPLVMVIDSKGKHLEGNPDTVYKRSVADYFEKVGRQVSWQQLGEDFEDQVFRFQILDEAQPRGRDWKDELLDMLATSNGDPA